MKTAQILYKIDNLGALQGAQVACEIPYLYQHRDAGPISLEI